MMYLVLVKVCYDCFDIVIGDCKLLFSLLLLNWVLGLVLMFVLVWLLLVDLFEYCIGLIIVGLVCCIVMVIIWNDLVCGDCEVVVVFVVLNLIF